MSSVLKFRLHKGHMLTEMKKKVQKSQILKKRKKNDLEIWRIATFSQILVLIRL